MIIEEFLNWCEGKWDNELKAQRLFSKLSNEDINFLKDQYEARLKADMMAMLEEIQLEIAEYKSDRLVDMERDEMARIFSELIQQKINALKAEAEGK